ncbi:MAG: choline dehydrogenase, partial [Aestuariibacter sp.]|nr:choline dehydrogenase [Aestuariibacter sp.]
IGLRWLTSHKGFGASNIWEAGGLVYSSEQVDYPNLQYHFAPVVASYLGQKIILEPGFTLQVDQLRPSSKGYVGLSSANPADKPAVHFNYLSDARDVEELIQGFSRIEDLIAQPAFDAFRGERKDPAADLKSRREIKEWVRATASTDFHPSCSCRMGDDDLSVVDSEMKVQGMERLRIVDASVMPNIVSG